MCKKLRDLLDATSLFRNTLMLHRKRTRSSSIALGIVNPSLTCQQTCRLGNNNACAFFKFKKKIKTHSPPPESHFHRTVSRKRAWKSAGGAWKSANSSIWRQILRWIVILLGNSFTHSFFFSIRYLNYHFLFVNAINNHPTPNSQNTNQPKMMICQCLAQFRCYSISNQMKLSSTLKKNRIVNNPNNYMTKRAYPSREIHQQTKYCLKIYIICHTYELRPLKLQASQNS